MTSENKIALATLLHSFFEKFVLAQSFLIPAMKLNDSSTLAVCIALAMQEIIKAGFEHFSGNLADKYGPHYIMAGGIILKSCGIALWIVSKSSSSLLAGAAILGLGKACITTKTEAYIYNNLQQAEKTSLFPQMETVKLFATNIAAIAAGIVQSFIYKSGGFDSVFLASIIIMLIFHLPIVLFLMPYKKQYTGVEVNHSKTIAKIAKQSIATISQNKQIMLLCALGAANYSTYIMAADSNKLLMIDLAIQPSTMALIYSASYLFSLIIVLALMINARSKILNLNAKKYMLIANIIMIFSAVIYNYYSIFCFAAYYAVFPLITIGINYKISQLASNNIRASIDSVVGTFYSTINAAMFIILGLISTYFTQKIATISIFSLSTAIIILTILTIKPQAKQSQPNHSPKIIPQQKTIISNYSTSS